MNATAEITLRPPRPAPRPKPRRHPPHDVLVLVSPDGQVEVYGRPNCRVLIAERLQVTPESEVLADDFLLESLPPWAKHLYFAGFRHDEAGELLPFGKQSGCLRATAAFRPRTAEDEVDRREAVAWLERLDAVVKRLEQKPQIEVKR